MPRLSKQLIELTDGWQGISEVAKRAQNPSHGLTTLPSYSDIFMMGAIILLFPQEGPFG
jgi:hypothetical protein